MKSFPTMFSRFIIIVICFSSHGFFNYADATIWIKNLKAYSPTVQQYGLKCLSTMTKFYFEGGNKNRTRNLMVSYTHNLKDPADEIQRLYLKWIHEAVMDRNILNESFLLELVTTATEVKKVSHEQSNTIYHKDYYVLIMDNFDRFKQLMRKFVTQSSFNPGAKFIIFFNNPDVQLTISKQGDFAFQLFKLMYVSYNAANVIFLIGADADTYNIFVTNPYQNQIECGSLQPLLLDTCTDGIFKRNDFTKKWVEKQKIPLKLPNCTFKFCARISAPYINEECKTGLEVEIIKVLQEKLLFNISTHCTDMDRGESQNNGSWSGILGLLRDDQCDFVVGGFFPDYDVHDDFGVTTDYLHDAYTWFVFIARKQPQWLAMLTIFSFETWAAFCLILVLSALTWYGLGHVSVDLVSEGAAHRKVALTILNTWCISLGNTANNRPRLSPLRIFFVTLTLYAINVTTIYTSKLINVFKNPPYEDQIDTIEEIINSQLPIGGREEYKDWFDNGNPLDQIIHHLYKKEEDFWPTPDNFKDVANGRRVILSNRVFILSQSIHEVFPLPFNVFANPLEMISERGFPLLKRFSNLIMYMRDAGIIEKLYDDFYYNVTTLHYIRDRSNDMFKETRSVLTLAHMNGAFTVLILGLLIGFVAFVLEIIFDMYSRRRKTKRLWKLLRNSMRQVSIMRTLREAKMKRGKNDKKGTSRMEMKRKWEKPKNSNSKRTRFDLTNEALKPKNW